MFHAPDCDTQPVPEVLQRPLLWWRVPERPGVGEAMIRNAVLWLVSTVALLVLLDVVR